MPKTKESIAAYNKEYFARPEVIARAKIRNAKYRKRRQEYKKTEAGIEAEKRYRSFQSPRQIEHYRLRCLYGIGIEDYENLLAAQEGKCAICSRTPEKLHVDHCHETKKVRGLLCGSCNRGIGLLQDRSEVLRSAADYLESHNAV